jgi:hypothetical protein
MLILPLCKHHIVIVERRRLDRQHPAARVGDDDLETAAARVDSHVALEQPVKFFECMDGLAGSGWRGRW